MLVAVASVVVVEVKVTSVVVVAVVVSVGVVEEAVSVRLVSAGAVVEALGAVLVSVVGVVVVSRVVVEVLVVLVVLVALGSYTTTVRTAEPTTPFWSVALYTIVCVPAAEVSIYVWSSDRGCPPSTLAMSPKLRSSLGPMIVAPKSL